MRPIACLVWLAAFLLLFSAHEAAFAQYVWTKDVSNPVLSGGGQGTWDYHLFMPSVLFNPDSNRYEMWYGGSFGPPWRPYRVGFAWSTNGVTWTKHARNPVFAPDSGAWDAYTTEGAFVLRENGTYKMWYTGMRTASSTWAIGYATSPDGVTWTKWPGNPIMAAGSASWEAGGVGDPSIVKEGNTYTMLYDGANATQQVTSIGRAVSSDGVTWVRDTINNPVLSPGAAGEWDDQNVLQPQVHVIANRQYLWYTGIKRVSEIRRIGLASSLNGGRSWSKERNAVVVPGPGNWDADLVEAGRVIQVDTVLHMWYSGTRLSQNRWQIGHATAPVVSPLPSAIWQAQNSNFPANVFVINFSTPSSQVCWAVGQRFPANTAPYAGYTRTTDGGTTWVCDTIPGLTNSYLDEVFALDAQTAFVTSYKLLNTTGSAGIYKTTDGGLSWSRQNAYNSSQTGPGKIHFFDSQNGVVIADYLETYTTTNGGMNWNPVSMPTPLQDEWIWLGESRFAVSGNTIWLCTNKGRVFKSTDRGYTWTVILSEAQYYDWRPSIAFQNSLIGIYALNIPGDATDHVVRKTTDGGATWVTLSNPVLANLAPSCIQYIPGTNSTYVMVGGRAPTMRGTAVSYDAGVSWTLLDTTGCFLTSFASGVRGWGSPFGGNVVYRYTGTPLPVEEETTLPAGCLLSQNYPNPFNPVTTIGYQLPRSGHVSLRVYDLLGREVAVLVDGVEEAGHRSVTFDASSLASGVYLYRLRAGEFMQTRKLAVVR